MSRERDKYRVTVHVGPVTTKQADEVLDRVRAYQGAIPAGGFMVGTESLYFDLDASDQIGATIKAQAFLMAVFGAGTGLTGAIRRCVRVNTSSV